MIFATVGTQLPFDRLVRTLDEWASQNPQVEVFAQIGRTNYVPRHVRWERAIPANTFRAMMRKCNTVVAHAGMGTIISAIEIGRQVVVMPRRADLNEHRNDHQLATAERLKHISGLEVAPDCQALTQYLDKSRDAASSSKSAVSPELVVSDQLIRKIRSFAGLAAA